MVLISYREISFNFDSNFRVYISGSSGSGKTHFAKELINSSLFDISRVHYFHPDYYETNPNDWQDTLSKEVIFRSQFPTRDDLLKLKENTCIVLDDLFETCVNSKDIDELFRVISRKHKIHVIVMTQRYFYPGKFNLSIRNCCNYHVLMRNVDDREVRRIGQTLGLVKDIIFANQVNEKKIYPYVFVDRNNSARALKLEIYTDIFSERKEVVQNLMKYYLITESDFNSCFKKKDSEIAEYVDSKSKKQNSVTDTAGNEQNEREKEEDSKQKRYRKKWRKRIGFERKVNRIIQQHSSGAKL